MSTSSPASRRWHWLLAGTLALALAVPFAPVLAQDEQEEPYEQFESTDWAVDNAPPNQLANVITMGGSSPDYDVWVTTFSVGYRF